MAESAAIIGDGTTIGYGSNSAATTSALLTEVITITPPAPEWGDVETTHLASDDDAKEYIAGLLEGGEFSFTLNYVEAMMGTLYGLHTRTKRYWRITYTDSSYFLAYGYLKSLGINEVEGEERMTIECTVKVSGKPTYTTN